MLKAESIVSASIVQRKNTNNEVSDMGQFFYGFAVGVISVLLGGFILCEVAEHCELPLEVEDIERAESENQ